MSDAEWHSFDRALIVEVNPATRGVSVMAEHETPAAARPDRRPSILFKCGSVSGDRLAVPTQTEILVYRVPGFELVRYASLPLFNDVHHARIREDGTILVANTGLDMLLELNADDTLGRQWAVADGDMPWDRFDPTIDYRRVPTTKPHRAHPNFVFELGADIWTTRFEQRDALCVTSGRQLKTFAAGPHDGLPHDGHVYFTSVDGRIMVADPRTERICRVIDLNAADATEPLGWCRGLLISGSTAWVGFSRLRPTAIRRNLYWAKERFSAGRSHYARPTRISAYDLTTGALSAEINLEDHGLNSVFSILPASRPGVGSRNT